MTEMGKRRKKISIQTDENGTFILPLPVQGDYLINVNRKGYLFYSKPWKNNTNDLLDSVRWNIPLTPIEKGSELILRNISFEKNSYLIGSDSFTELEQLTQLMKENTTIKIEIAGHTDNEGKKADNLLLSQKRAKAVVEYLIGKGISAERLTFGGYGDTKPIATNDTEQGKSLNRRTEINVVSLQ
jgi:outer membrane protein OmpA-like peptidoglycan-associated protein